MIGVGLKYYGWKNYFTDGVMEEYDTTKWFCIAWLPIVPIGSYRIRRKRPSDIISRIAKKILLSEEIEVIYKRKLDFGQILRVFLVTYGSFFLIVEILDKIYQWN